MAISYSRNERIYPIVESTFGVIPTFTGANNCKFKKVKLKPIVARLTRTDKTGVRSEPLGVGGRRSATWSVDMSLAPNGTPGVAPDCDPILQAIFGQAPTIVSSTSVTYNLSDAIKSFSLPSYRTPSTMMQRIAAGCVVTDATFNFGQDVADWQANGKAYWVVDSKNFATLDTPGKCGLASWPDEPSTPVTNGPMIAGFTGVATFDTNVLANILTASVKIASANDIPLNTFGTYYGDLPEGDVRVVSLTFVLKDKDESATSNLYQKAITKAPITVILQSGTAAGSIATLTLKGIQLDVPDLDDNQRAWTANFGESTAHPSTPAALDEVTLAFT